jgi:two-component system, cell cycle response regulator DivK
MKKKIMVIDDDLDVVEYLTTLFEDNGYTVCSAQGGEAGVALAKTEQPDLITLDLEMPGEWGPRVFRRLSGEDDLKNIPVIVISGLSGNEHAIQKAVASLTKPFDRDELIGLVRDVLD